MTLDNFKKLARALIPGAKSTVVKPTILELVLNNAVIDIAAFTVCLKANKKFNVIADQDEYNISSVVDDFLVPDKSGLYWNIGDGTTPDWEQLESRTLAWLDKNRPTWRDDASGDPIDYSIDGDVLTINPPPDTALTNGLWLYYGKKPVAMTAGGQYPFSGSTTEYPHLVIFDDAILEYAKWKLAPMLNKKVNEELARKEYLRVRGEKNAYLLEGRIYRLTETHAFKDGR